MRWKPKNSTKMVEAYQRPKAFKKARDIFFFRLAILPFDSDITPLGDFEKKQGDEGMEPGGNPSHGFPIVMFC